MSRVHPTTGSGGSASDSALASELAVFAARLRGRPRSRAAPSREGGHRNRRDGRRREREAEDWRGEQQRGEGSHLDKSPVEAREELRAREQN